MDNEGEQEINNNTNNGQQNQNQTNNNTTQNQTKPNNNNNNNTYTKPNKNKPSRVCPNNNTKQNNNQVKPVSPQIDFTVTPKKNGQAFSTYFDLQIQCKSTELQCKFGIIDEESGEKIYLTNVIKGKKIKARSILPKFTDCDYVQVFSQCRDSRGQEYYNYLNVTLQDPTSKNLLPNNCTMNIAQSYILYEQVLFLTNQKTLPLIAARKAILNILDSLDNQNLSDQHQDKLEAFILAQLSNELVKDSVLLQDPQIQAKIEDLIDKKLNFGGEDDSSNCSIDYKNNGRVLTSDPDTFAYLSATLNNMIKVEDQKQNMINQLNAQNGSTLNNGSTGQKSEKYVKDFQIGLSSLSNNISEDQGQVQIKGDSISGSLQKVKSDTLSSKGTKLEVPNNPNPSKPSTLSQNNIKVEIPANHFGNYDEYVVKAVVIDPKVIKSEPSTAISSTQAQKQVTSSSSNTSLTSNNKSVKNTLDSRDLPELPYQQFASNILILNIDAPQKNKPGYMQTLKVQDLPMPIKFLMPITQPQTEEDYECKYYNETSKQWQPLPGKYLKDNKTMECETTHMSQFAVFATPAKDQRFLVYIVVGLLDASLVILIFTALWLEAKQQPKKKRKQRDLKKMMKEQFEEEKQLIEEYVENESITFSNQVQRYQKYQKGDQFIQKPIELKPFIREVDPDQERLYLEEKEPQGLKHIYHNILKDNHRIISSLIEDPLSRVFRVFSNQSQFYLLLAFVSYLVYRALQMFTVIGIVFVTFFLMRFVQIFMKRLQNKVKDQGNCCSTFLMFIVYLGLIIGGQVIAINICEDKWSTSKNIAIVFISMLLTELILWDLILMPLIMICYDKLYKDKNNSKSQYKRRKLN